MWYTVHMNTSSGEEAMVLYAVEAVKEEIETAAYTPRIF